MTGRTYIFFVLQQALSIMVMCSQNIKEQEKRLAPSFAFFARVEWYFNAERRFPLGETP